MTSKLKNLRFKIGARALKWLEVALASVFVAIAVEVELCCWVGGGGGWLKVPTQRSFWRRPYPSISKARTQLRNSSSACWIFAWQPSAWLTNRTGVMSALRAFRTHISRDPSRWYHDAENRTFHGHSNVDMFFIKLAETDGRTTICDCER